MLKATANATNHFILGFISLPCVENDLNVAVTQNESATIAGGNLVIGNPTVWARITNLGVLTCASGAISGSLSCGSLTVNSNPIRRTNETIALNSVNPTASTTGNSAVSGWSTSYTGSGGYQKIAVHITCIRTNASLTIRSWSIQKNSTTVATGSFLHTQETEKQTIHFNQL